METVGFIGVGKIGLPISENLIKSGYRVLGYRRSSLADFEKIGGVPARSPAAAPAAPAAPMPARTPMSSRSSRPRPHPCPGAPDAARPLARLLPGRLHERRARRRRP